jgi:hypothetical protein
MGVLRALQGQGRILWVIYEPRMATWRAVITATDRQIA